ncbi:MAG: S-adenosylmethionine:tRNA ribosyltransferase-isomerase [Prevotellaceae bacterium]|nr:S-adenosylmethionine:tRNA ribosyltransferase-isomerase [Prevotellaceae bacterium]
MKPKLSISNYTYLLPDERIAKFPLSKRDESKLLLYQSGNIYKSKFFCLADFLPKDSLLIFNNTKVIHARLFFRKDSGAKIEVFCLEPINPPLAEQALSAHESCEWQCIVGNLKRWKADILKLEYTVGGAKGVLTAEKKEQNDANVSIRFSWTGNHTFGQIVEACGQLPIPPYLKRDTEEADKTTYQTVYAKYEGSVAAPTAGLHFTKEVFQSFKTRNIECEELTLHVGAGTFKPVKTDTIDLHEMHCEHFSIKQTTLKHIIDKLSSKKIVAVGTTSVRTLESLYYLGLKIIRNKSIEPQGLFATQWEPYHEETSIDISVATALNELLLYMQKRGLYELWSATSIMIAPPYQFKAVNGLITNFHQPQSTLLLLVAALIGGDWHKVYDYALNNDFRFLSYGDSSLLIP